MVCCKADEFGGWCKNLEDSSTVEGKRYCVFHAPKEHKGKPFEEFNSEVYGLIQLAVRSGSECNLSGIVIPGDFHVEIDEDFDSLPEINFKKATFCGKADFHSATFSGNANFYEAEFLDEADFRFAKFLMVADFKNVAFSKLATFSFATFTKKVSFNDAIFAGYANFIWVIFFSDAHFFDVSFKNGAIFQDRPKIGRLTFNEGAVFFIRVDTKNERILFKEVDFTDKFVSFLETDLTGFRCDCCVWSVKKYWYSGLRTWLDTKMFGLFVSDDTVAFYDEIKTDQGFAVTPSKKKLSCVEQSQRYGMIEDLYRQMKVQYKETHNEPEASKWHYREKEMFRKKKIGRRRFPLSITNLYWAFSGYGERPVRAGIILTLLFAVIGIVMNELGLQSGPGSEVIQGFSFSPNLAKIGLVTQAIIEHSLFIKDPILKAHPGWGTVLLTLWCKLLIPIQAALFAFALRNKFRR